MFLLFFCFAFATGQVIIHPDQFDMLYSKLQDIEERVASLSPAFNRLNLTSIDDVRQFIDIGLPYTLAGNVNDFELKFKSAFSLLPDYTHFTAYYSPGATTCNGGPTPMGGVTGPVIHSTPHVCSYNDDDYYALFDFPVHFQISLLKYTGYFWTVSIYPVHTIQYSQCLDSSTTFDGTVAMRLRQAQPLNETIPFKLANFENSLYNMAINKYKRIDWDSNDDHYTDYRVLSRSFHGCTIRRQIDSPPGLNSQALGCLRSFPPNNTRSVKYFNAVKGKDVNIHESLVTTQVLAYDYQQQRVYATTYSPPGAFPVQTLDTGTSKTYRPQIDIQHSFQQFTYLNSIFPQSPHLVLLAVRHYYQDSGDDTRKCYGSAIGHNTPYDPGYIKSALNQLPTTALGTLPILNSMLTSLLSPEPPIADVIDSRDCAGFLKHVLSECIRPSGGLAYHHNNLPPLFSTFDPEYAFIGNRFVISSRPAASYTVMGSNADRFTPDGINHTAYYPPVYYLSPSQYYIGKPSTPYPDPHRIIPARIQSLAETITNVIDDAFSVVEEAWLWIEKISALFGDVESLINDPQAVWGFLKEKGFFGALGNIAEWFARENFPV